MNILIATVGGSCEPIVTAIKSCTPDHVVFLCSPDSGSVKGSHITVNGPGLVCGGGRDKQPDKPSIATQAGLATDRMHIKYIARIDDPNDCYQTSLAVIQEIQQRWPGARIIADYTGGTKSMSLGLGAAAFDCEGVELSVVKGTRVDLVKVQDGTQRAGRISTDAVLARRQIAEVSDFLVRYDYPGLLVHLQTMSRLQHLPADLEDQLQETLTFARGLNAWDRFDHRGAIQLLLPHSRKYGNLVQFLKAVCHSRAAMDPDWKADDVPKIKIHGYEVVQDLLLNAQRRAAQERYDDAVARLYRALELLVQVRLKLSYQIETGNVDTNKIPEASRAAFPDKKIGLERAYNLLLALSQDDPLSQLYAAEGKGTMDAVTKRNNSILAHGFRPVSQEDYENSGAKIESFISRGLDRILADTRVIAPSQQFPTRLEANVLEMA